MRPAVRADRPGADRVDADSYPEDLVITPAVRDLRRRHPAVHVRTRHLDWDETGAPPDRRVDVLVARTPLPIPADDLRATLRDDLVTVPVDGIEPCQVVVVTRAGDRNPLVAHFVESAKNLLLRDA